MYMLDSEVEEFFKNKLKVKDHMVTTTFFKSNQYICLCVVLYFNPDYTYTWLSKYSNYLSIY